MSKRKCGYCGHDPACGLASINDTYYCHDDECDGGDVSCYQLASWAMPTPGWAVSLERQTDQ